jgi:hypothetical protein
MVESADESTFENLAVASLPYHFTETNDLCRLNSATKKTFGLLDAGGCHTRNAQTQMPPCSAVYLLRWGFEEWSCV